MTIDLSRQMQQHLSGAEAAARRCDRIVKSHIKQAGLSSNYGKYAQPGDLLAALKLPLPKRRIEPKALFRKYHGRGNTWPDFLPLRPDYKESPAVMQGKIVAFSGEFVGHFRGHFHQFIKITQLGNSIALLKITGDDNVPGGELSGWYDLSAQTGGGQIAEKEFANAVFVPAELKDIEGTLQGNVFQVTKFTFIWENCGKVEFVRDDAPFNPHVLSFERVFKRKP